MKLYEQRKSGRGKFLRLFLCVAVMIALAFPIAVPLDVFAAVKQSDERVDIVLPIDEDGREKQEWISGMSDDGRYILLGDGAFHVLDMKAKKIKRILSDGTSAIRGYQPMSANGRYWIL